VEVDIQTWYAENNPETFLDAQKRILERARKIPVEWGDTIFPGKTGGGTLLFSDSPDKFANAIRTTSGNRTFGFHIFITVSYRINGDTPAHVTQYVFSNLNVRIPTVIAQSQAVQVQPMPFLSAVID
jgi:hypothetical protein